MERGDTEEKILNTEKKPKKQILSRFIKIGIIILITIVVIIFLISKHYNIIIIHYELSEKRKNKLNSSEIKMKLNSTFEYNESNKIVYTVRIWGEPEKGIFSRTFKEQFFIKALSQFPSGNFIAYDYIFFVIYDEYFNILQTISPFVDK